ncbi:MAG TPA: hypothetical protein DHV72_03345 [Serratia grimesii]|jgi:hypothetical protein|uniref:Lipoprotein n=1 Tax=Serratia grimesii TaxID=82995 RepID=A0A9C7QS34_9GAMM|nr:membrane lipoprotein lipid attachment site-containing protein [Serratia grimesii]KFB89022.1 hypothetical protein CR62_24420 [Serratia grimesii]CAI1532951.1 Uncharacterised protein [Serratia grimesii]HCJ99045.1 hypothetical protein [Serratia grimesii]
MRKLLIVALGVVVLSGCADQKDDYELHSKTSTDPSGSKEWKEFVAPLSVKTQSPGEREMKRAIRQN